MTENTVRVIDIYNYIDSFAPFSSAMDFDNVGILVGNKEKAVNKVLTCLDITPSAIESALTVGAQLIVSHHPVIFDPINSVSANSAVYKLCREGIDAICAHTNLDAAAGGVNDVLCNIIGLQNIEIWEPEKIGRIGYTESDLNAFAKTVSDKLGIKAVNVVDSGNPVRKVAVMGGSGGGDINNAILAGADTLLTGEMKHSRYIEARSKGLNVVTAGHFDTEFPVIPVLSEMLKNRFPSLEITVFREPSYTVCIRS
jgi:dinuclear metal center YbgI/SA1388 family protein